MYPDNYYECLSWVMKMCDDLNVARKNDFHPDFIAFMEGYVETAKKVMDKKYERERPSGLTLEDLARGWNSDDKED